MKIRITFILLGMIASTWGFSQNEQLLKVFNDQVEAFNLGM